MKNSNNQDKQTGNLKYNLNYWLDQRIIYSTDNLETCESGMVPYMEQQCTIWGSHGFTLEIGSKTINYRVDPEVEGKKGLDISEHYVYYEEYCDGLGTIEIQTSDPKSLVPHKIKGGLIQSLIDKDKKIFHIYKNDEFQGKINEYDSTECNTGMFEM
jgi:hypothetical protein